MAFSGGSRYVGMLAGLLVAGGCEQLPDLPDLLEPLTMPWDDSVAVEKMNLPDVPTPPGFALRSAESRSGVVPGVRTVRREYRGEGAVGEIEQFYRDRLPVRGWRQADTQEGLICYTKGYEKLWIRIRKQLTRTAITLAIDDRKLDAMP